MWMRWRLVFWIVRRLRNCLARGIVSQKVREIDGASRKWNRAICVAVLDMPNYQSSAATKLIMCLRERLLLMGGSNFHCAL